MATLDEVLAEDDVIYSCEIQAGVRGWDVGDFDETIAEEAIGTSVELVRAFVSAAFYVATAAYASEAGTPFPGRLSSISFRRSISNGQFFGGVASGDGELEIDNSDGRYDALVDHMVAGRVLILRVGRRAIPYVEWPVIFQGTARDWIFDESTIRIAMRDDNYRLGVPAQTSLYLGTGGAEGGDELKDKRKPLVFGYAINLRPPVLNTDLVYQITDGELDDVFEVRDRGLALTFGADRANYAALVAAVIAPGSYDTCLAEGYIRLGASPDGTVTADAATYRSTGTATISDIVRGIIEDRTAITEFDDASFTALEALYPDDAGLFIDENDNSTVADVVSLLLTGITGYVTFLRTGECTVGIVVLPDNPAAMTLGMSDIVDLAYERLPSLLSPPPWRLRLSYAHNFTVQTDLSGAADPIYAQPAKVTSASDSDVLADNPLAQDLEPQDTYLVDAAAADAEVLRQFAIFSVTRALRRVRLSRRAMSLEIGNVIDLDYDRLGGRRLGVIVEDDINVPAGEGGEVDTLEVSLYG